MIKNFIAHNSFSQNIYWFDVIIDVDGGNASNVAELQTYAMPAIFIPILNSIDDHQTVNAKNACKNGGGIYLSEKSFSEDLFLKEITSFYNSDLNKRSKNMKKQIAINQLSIVNNFPVSVLAFPARSNTTIFPSVTSPAPAVIVICVLLFTTHVIPAGVDPPTVIFTSVPSLTPATCVKKPLPVMTDVAPFFIVGVPTD